MNKKRVHCSSSFKIHVSTNKRSTTLGLVGGGGGPCPGWGWGSALGYMIYMLYIICYIFDNIIIHVWSESDHGFGRMKGRGGGDGGGYLGPGRGGEGLVINMLYIYAIYLITL